MSRLLDYFAAFGLCRVVKSRPRTRVVIYLQVVSDEWLPFSVHWCQGLICTAICYTLYLYHYCPRKMYIGLALFQ
jgi:hypothetical protein